MSSILVSAEFHILSREIGKAPCLGNYSGLASVMYNFIALDKRDINNNLSGKYRGIVKDEYLVIIMG